MSTTNGKIEFDAGALRVAPSSTMFMARFAGTLTLPVGDRFGIQADVTAATAPGFTTGAALHVFTRDPASYLIGGTLGVVSAPGATVVALGPEAELYFDRWTLEAWAGGSIARPTAGGRDRVLPFAMADLAYYLDDNWRLSVGVSSLDGFNAVHFGSEYQFDSFNLPLSLDADARIGQDGSVLATVGLRLYLGPPGKTLIRRHREDDPADRSAALFTALGGPTVAGTPVPVVAANTDSDSSASSEPSADDASVGQPPVDDGGSDTAAGGTPSDGQTPAPQEDTQAGDDSGNTPAGDGSEGSTTSSEEPPAASSSSQEPTSSSSVEPPPLDSSSEEQPPATSSSEEPPSATSSSEEPPPATSSEEPPPSSSSQEPPPGSSSEDDTSSDPSTPDDGGAPVDDGGGDTMMCLPMMPC